MAPIGIQRSALGGQRGLGSTGLAVRETFGNIGKWPLGKSQLGMNVESLASK